VGAAIRLDRRAGALCALLLTVPLQALAQDGSTELGQVVVTATRTGKPAFDVPASIDAVAVDPDGNQLGVNLSEFLGGVPGLVIRDRQDYAQDQQLSVRGFGARAQFGIVGVRLYLDGIPATQPDGQGQASHFNLDSAERIEVLRGPFSALYGNASGGVVQMFTAPGSGPAQVQADAMGGAYGEWRTGLEARGALGRVGYNVDYSHFHTDGYRAHSRALRDSGNARLDFAPLAGNKLTVVANTFSSPESLDPMGLTPGQFRADPRQAVASAYKFNTRKSLEQAQGGVIDEQALGGGQSLRFMAYYGHRIVKQFQSIPEATQGSPTSPGGVIDLHNSYGGADGRWTAHWQLFGQPLNLVAGLSYDALDSHRRGYNDFSAPGVDGVQGALRRDENNDLHDFDQYLQLDWDLSPRWSSVLGVRHSEVHFNSIDHYIAAGNPDDSGQNTFYATTPAAALMFKATPGLHLYASYGEGFDTPTFDNLAYRPDGQPGLNFALVPARTGTGELGAKWKLGQASSARLAVFRSITRNEIAVASSSGGRSTYQNVGRSRRQGVEAEYEAALGGRWRWQLAYTYLDAVYRQAFLSCTGTPCKPAIAPGTMPCAQDGTPLNPPLPANTACVPADNRIPAVPESQLYTALRWGGETGWNAALEGSYLSAVGVNDLNSLNAPAYGLLGINGAYIMDLPHWRVQVFARADNLLDTRYVGAVVINDGNQQYYQPGAGRAAFAGVRLGWKQ
jgi:iron complex outermembrane receptor protein